MKIKLFISVLILLLLTTISFCTPIYVDAHIQRIIDGDTYVVKFDNGLSVRVRLKDIDTFETKNNKRAKKQSEYFHISIDEVITRGLNAKNYVNMTYRDIDVCLKMDDYNNQDVYGRFLAHIYPLKCDMLTYRLTRGITEDKTINQILLEKGLAFNADLLR